MNKLFLCLLFTALAVNASSQRVYFVYLQSEQEQPFFVRMNESVYSSSPSGYLILSKLRDSSYTMAVGFPQGKWPEQKFLITVRAKDQGFLLKNFEGKGWGLFDFQTLAVNMALPETVKESGSKAEAKDVSPFTNMLAKAADDSTLRDKPVIVKKEEKPVVKDTVVAKIAETKPVTKEPLVTKPVEEKAVVKTEPPTEEPKNNPAIKQAVAVETAAVKTDPPKAEVKEPVITKPSAEPPKTPVISELPDKLPEAELGYIRSVVTRRSESSTTEGFGLTFIDQYSNGAIDTINILIPNTKPIIAAPKEQPREEKKFLDISSDTPVVKPILPELKTEQPKPETIQPVKDTVAITAPPVVANTNCREVATEADFLKLRKAMAAVESDDEMLDEAKKYFKTKCFATVQIKNLGALFLTDAGKYKFFDLAYNYVSDADKFPSLQSELKEEYYINRFKAMLK